ncbi:23S rRNA (uracil(1939)-C(5))-methyltransferase RlmD [Neomoorella humiferrea]|uniref:23S rRNA (Uracil-C(5))-methyltransferase RlmCD n=1 Tax=Neomoorella humiferrea TaxID=676965 RepID=A0A2T0AJU0_9FIRM|nr:23S rRNA (uracil(1939)-C(5))-methyltransferase RlmD [Moorella humiferrea]PRR68598.1 23S rRNA (uracil-C(5))-methyltransferase RlmCD [Moorella humiferrea]
MQKIEITGLNHEGAGVGRLPDGMVAFVPGALPGERVKIELSARKKHYALARLLEIEKASPDRVLPPCPEAGSCGGCQLQHLDYRAQLLWKRRLVVEALRRLGGLRDVSVLPVLGMVNPWGYRNKVRLHVADNSLGFYRPGSHEVVPFFHCRLVPSEFMEVVRELARLLPVLGRGPEHVILRRGWATGEMLLALEARTGWTEGEVLAGKLSRRFPELVGVVALPSGEGYCETILLGRNYLEERLDGLRFHISATTFFQVNSAQAQVLYELAAAMAGLQGGEKVLDAYCGSGAIAMWLSRRASMVIGVEVVEGAVQDARRNAVLNKVDNLRFHVGAAERLLPHLAAEGYRPEVVVLDPPRAGCDRRVIDAVAVMQPRRIVYVSCNPATLARDLALLQKRGYTPGPVQPVDMFPHTYHIECVCRLDRM